MKRLFCILICLVAASFSAYAQKKDLAEAGKKLKAASEKIPSGIPSNVGRITRSGALGSAANQAVRSSSKMPQVGKQPKGLTPSAAARMDVKIDAKDLRQPAVARIQGKMETPELERARLEQERLKREIAAREAAIQAAKATHAAQTFSADFGRSVLSIPNLAIKENPNLLDEYDEAVQAYSMTIVKTTYNGVEEIFGIIPTHSLPATSKAARKMFGVTRKFQAKLTMPDGSEQLIPGEVVQISPHSMLDISLVKFDPEVEALLTPLEISREPSAINEPILSPGYANNRPMIFNRIVTQNSFISMRTNLIKAPLDQRQGFCGSPLLDPLGRVKAIHTGSWNESSYGTRASFIDNLVEAYHNNGVSTYDLVLDDEVLTTLNVDEFISAFAVADEKMNILYKADGLEKDGHPFEKYSENRLRNAKKIPGARYLILHSRTPRWQKVVNSDELWLMENRTDINVDLDKLREHVYDLQTHQLLREPFTYTDFYKDEFYDMDEHPMLFLKQLDGLPIKR